ncbi:transposase [Stutzerimonas stutzeri]|uniref:transposase n=1 Tax=Stutzerimonas stutzeri TaxID=316 RepID=UPI00210C82BC|nr:transposase [Stutzerimonas stutzeri]MCQ4322790.1 hypothetical protein [Stutzerimonas stutzeri]
MLADLPHSCDVGSKCNSQGFTSSWIGCKLHLNVADGMIPLSAMLTWASVHDSQVAIPLATMSAQCVSHCHGLMDAAYCSPIIRAHSQSLGHVPLIDHSPRGGSKLDFAPHQAQRFKGRSTVERVNGRLTASGMAKHGPARGWRDLSAQFQLKFRRGSIDLHYWYIQKFGCSIRSIAVVEFLPKAALIFSASVFMNGTCCVEVALASLNRQQRRNRFLLCPTSKTLMRRVCPDAISRVGPTSFRFAGQPRYA